MSLKSSMLRSISLLALVAAAAAAQAVAVTYTVTGTGSGTLNNVVFGPSPITFTGLGDTDGLYFNEYGTQFLDLRSLTVSGSFGTATYRSGPRVFLSPSNQVFGVSFGERYDSMYLQGDVFAGQSLERDLPTTSVSGSLTRLGRGPVDTTAGILQFDSFRGETIRFEVDSPSAPSVPGPVAALPFALIALKRRKRA